MKVVVAILAVVMSLGPVCGQEAPDTRRDDDPHARLDQAIAAAPGGAMKAGGLVGVTGGARVSVMASGEQEVILPIPQMAATQVPVCWFLRSEPADAIASVRIEKRDDTNAVARVRINGVGREVRIQWAAAVLMTAASGVPHRTPGQPYRTATACVQSQAPAITKLAGEIAPDTGGVVALASSIQRHIRGMRRVAPPRSLDAQAALESGENTICTSNANLAAALMRARWVACRTVAVVPAISHRLEMHRVVEYWDDRAWHAFDPSSLQPDVPSKPWQNVIMAWTTIADEEAAMMPRMGAMRGCPYGQEIEVLTPGVAPIGQDFFWTLAKPLAAFEPGDEAMARAVVHWTLALGAGTAPAGRIEAALATSADAFAEALRAR